METHRHTAFVRLAVLLPVTVGFLSCRDDCGGGIVSCPPRYAISVTVTAQGTGAPVADAMLDVTGALIHTIPCVVESGATVCRVVGGFGNYELEIRAPGFHSERQSTTVEGDIGECGCPIPETRNLRVALLPRT